MITYSFKNYTILYHFFLDFFTLLYYPYTMPSLITKWKKGKPYLYWVRSARVNGQPRIVEQVYLGPKDRVLQTIYQTFTQGSAPPPPTLKRVQVREFGASAVFWALAQELGLMELIDAVVPPPPKDRRTELSVGAYLVLAAINRVIAPHSKRSFGEWYGTTVLRRWVEVSWTTLTSARFWDHMERVTSWHIQKIQQDLVVKLADLFALDGKVLIYDTTNYYTFINTFNARAALPQRGKNKQKRADLRQLSLAVVLEETSGLPVYHRCYEGNLTDVRALRPLLDDLVKVMPPKVFPSEGDASFRSTLILDKGNVSMENLHALRKAGFSFLAAIPATWKSALWNLPLSAYDPVEVKKASRVKVAVEEEPEWDGVVGCVGKALLVFSPSFYRQQVRTLDRLQEKADVRLQQVAASLQTSRRGEPAVRKEIMEGIRHDLLAQYFSYTLSVKGKRVLGVQWQWDLPKKVHLKHQHFGRTLLYTDRQDLAAHRVVALSREQAQVEALFRISKSRRPGLWWPAYHWTDTKLRVHALTCFLGLLLLQVVLKRLYEHHLSIGVERLMEQLRGIQETLVIYVDGSSERVLAECTPQQEELCDALKIYDLATQMGNTVLSR